MNEPSGNTLTIGIDGDLPWTPSSTTAAGYPGIGLRAQYNSFTATDDTIFQYKFSGNAADWQAGTAGSVIDSGPLGLDGDPMPGRTDLTTPEAGSPWLEQSMHLNYRSWLDSHSTARVPIKGITIPKKTPFTFQWWMKLYSWPRFSAGGIFSPSPLDGYGDYCIKAYGNHGTNSMYVYARGGSWPENDPNYGCMVVPYSTFDDGEWHHFRFVNDPWPDMTHGFGRYMYVDGVLVDSWENSDWWRNDFTIAGDHYLGHYSRDGDTSRPYNWTNGIDADFDDVVLDKSVIDDAISRWKYDGETAIGCSAVQAVDFGGASKISGVSWSEATASSDERLQSIEIDDGLGYQTVWTYGGAVDVSGLAPASAYNIRITQRHSTDAVHEFAHILESLTLDYSTGGYRRPPLAYRMGPRIWQGVM